MKTVSMVALAAVLSLGVTAPAMAQRSKPKEDKKEQAAGPQLKVSPEYRKVAGAAEAALKGKDFATAAARITEAETMAKNDDEKFYAAELRLQLGSAQRSKPDQLKAIEVLLVNPHTSPERVRLLGAYQQFAFGLAAMDKKDPAAAIPLLLKARELGSTEIDLPIMLANAYSATGKMAESVAEVDRAVQQSKANGEKPPEAWYRFAIPRVNTLGDRAQTAAWMTRLLADYPTVSNWRWGIVVYRESKGRGGSQLRPEQRIDLFRLMRATGSLADQQDFFDYAKVAVEQGYPVEALAVIDEGKKSETIPAEAPAFADIVKTAKSGLANETPLEELVKSARASANGKEAASAGDVLLGMKDYARAIELYDIALQKGGVDTDAINLHRGSALVLAGRKADAGSAFAAVKAAPLSDIAQFWITWISLPAPLAS